MGDIFVHLRMKVCCRSVLKELDTHKKKAKHKGGALGVKSLFDLLSEKTIADAKIVIPEAASGSDAEFEALTRSACASICAKHAEEHAAKGESEEGDFWRSLTTAVQNQSAK